MALIKCPECGKEITDKAPACIHCGYPIQANPTQETAPEQAETEKEDKGEAENTASPVSAPIQSQPQTSGVVNKIPKGLLWGVVCLLIAVIAVLAAYALYLSPAAKYKIAEKAFDNGDYSKAIAYYEAAGEYMDSAEKAETSTTLYYYSMGKEYLAAEDWENAKTYFNSCRDYADSEELITKSDYGYANSLLKEQKYEEAKSAFEKIEEYSDSTSKIKECNYNIALKYESNNDLLKAAELFGLSEGYSDSTNHILSIGEKLVTDKNYADAVTVYGNLDEATYSQNAYVTYAEAQVKLAERNYSEAITLFKSAGDTLDAKEMYKLSTYTYGKYLMEKKDFTEARKKFASISGYEDSDNLMKGCILLNAKYEITKGNLNSAKSLLSEVRNDFSYSGVTAAGLNEILEKNKQWVDICGKWTSTGGQMRTTQVGSYKDWWWYIDFNEGDYNIEVRCLIDDWGNVRVKVTGSIPVYTNYSSLGSLLKTSSRSVNSDLTMSKLGSIYVDDYTSVTLSNGKITANYKKRDNTVDSYFTYVYKTDVIYGKRVKAY